MKSPRTSTAKKSASTLYRDEAKVGDARERVVRTAYDLFSLYGLSAVGVDRVIDEAGVAKMTLYRHFGSKDDLVLAVLARREERWSRSWLQEEITARARTPRTQLLACFDVFEDWFTSDTYEGCLFLNTLLETRDVSSPIGRACIAALDAVRSMLADLARQAGVRDPKEFAARWQLLLWGAIVGASFEGTQAVTRARAMGKDLLERQTRAGR